MLEEVRIEMRQEAQAVEGKQLAQIGFLKKRMEEKERRWQAEATAARRKNIEMEMDARRVLEEKVGAVQRQLREEHAAAVAGHLSEAHSRHASALFEAEEKHVRELEEALVEARDLHEREVQRAIEEALRKERAALAQMHEAMQFPGGAGGSELEQALGSGGEDFMDADDANVQVQEELESQLREIEAQMEACGEEEDEQTKMVLRAHATVRKLATKLKYLEKAVRRSEAREKATRARIIDHSRLAAARRIKMTLAEEEKRWQGRVGELREKASEDARELERVRSSAEESREELRR